MWKEIRSAVFALSMVLILTFYVDAISIVDCGEDCEDRLSHFEMCAYQEVEKTEQICFASSCFDVIYTENVIVCRKLGWTNKNPKRWNQRINNINVFGERV